MSENKITFLTCWWTIDKDYWVWKWIYDVEVWKPSINKIIEKIDLNYNFEVIEVLRKDSLDMDDEDRNLIKQYLEDIENDRIIITHWTDTMIETWKRIQNINNKVVVLVWSARPRAMNNSDAEFNIWYALWILDILANEKRYWIYLAMNWHYFDLNNVKKCNDWVFRKINN